jgi:hypothetical protein
MKIVTYARDLLVLSGIVLVARGTFLFSEPLGYVVLGVLLATVGIVGVLRAPGTSGE